MRVEYLNLPENRVGNEDAGSSLADEPVAGQDIYRRPIQRVRVYSRSQDRKARQNDKSSSQSTTNETGQLR